MPSNDPKFKQICTGQYAFSGGVTFSVIGLTEDGRVLKYRFGQGWVELDEPTKLSPQQRIARGMQATNFKDDEEAPF